jgi:hypothetical protein
MSRRLPEGFGQHHRSVAGDVAMGRIARRLGGEPGQVEGSSNALVDSDVLHRRLNHIQEMRKQIHSGL